MGSARRCWGVVETQAQAWAEWSKAPALRAPESPHFFGDLEKLQNWSAWAGVAQCLRQLLCCGEALCESTAEQKRLVGETGELRKAALSASSISVKFSHKWRSNTTQQAMAQLITWAVVFVAHSSKFVALHSFLKAAGSGPDLSMEQRSLAWKTYRTAMVWRAEPA